jgi:hypothetical protein
MADFQEGSFVIFSWLVEVLKIRSL